MKASQISFSPARWVCGYFVGPYSFSLDDGVLDWENWELGQTGCQTCVSVCVVFGGFGAGALEPLGH